MVREPNALPRVGVDSPMRMREFLALQRATRWTAIALFLAPTVAHDVGLPAAKPPSLLAELRALIAATRQTVSQGISSALVLLYWQIGQRIRTDILKQKRAGYGEQIVHALSAKLAAEFGRGFTPRNLFNMVSFAETFPHRHIVHALRG